MTSERDCVLPLLAATDPVCAGRKAATLATLAADGFPVPDGLVLTVAALDAVCAALGRAPSQDDVRAAPLPSEVIAGLESIAAHFGDAPVAVRSSAVDEDRPDASYAGQYETVLHVVGLTALREAVRRCWASALGDRVREYQDGRAPGRPKVAVLVQAMAEADVAGVAFTADPVTGARDEVLVSAVPGLGDVLVGGATQPDEWSVAGETATPVRVVHQALTATQSRAIAALARRVEERLGAPQDIEWAMAGGRLILLQARPITALPVPPRERELPPGSWVKEVERHPEPLHALGAALAGELIGRGLTAMSAGCGGLIERFDARLIGGEPYMRVTPVGGRGGPPPPWWLLGILARIAPPLRRRMRTARWLLRSGELDRLQQRWDEQWRPELQRTFARLHAVDLAAVDDQGLVAHLDEVLATFEHAMDVHFRLIPPYLVPVHGLVVACRELLGWPDAAALHLLAGASPATSGAARELAELAARVRANPAALAALDRAGSDLGVVGGVDAELGAAVADWCARYGRRNVNDDPGSPTLAELPWLLTGLLRQAVGGQSERAAAESARQLDRARAELAGRPAADRDRFEAALAAALRAYPLREDSAFWTGSMPGGAMRRAALEIGRRLAGRGVLAHAEDAVHLDVTVLRAALVRPDPDGAALRAAVARARAERAWTRAHPGPSVLGDSPPPFPDLRGLPAAGRRVNEALLWMQRSEQPDVPGADVVASGVPASPGTFTGPVRVVTGVADFGRLRAGEVLVCRTTDPAWTVLFGVAGALVTDGGGVLSHAAIVAREHAIPAVVGTGSATTILRDGQLVTVDGTAGVITLGGRPDGREGSRS